MFIASREGLYQVEAKRPPSLALLIAGGSIGGLAGLLVSIGLGFGFSAHFPGEEWALVFWGDHALLRILGSSAATAAGGGVAGLIAARRGALAGAISVVPALVLWLYMALSAWTDTWFFFSSPLTLPEGGLFSATIIPLILLPIGVVGGRAGADYRRRHEAFFAARPGLLGIRLKHYVWIPIFALLILTQAAWAAVIGWRVLEISANGDLLRFPLFILIGIGFVLLWRGARGVYLSLTDSTPVGVVAKLGRVLKFGVAYPVGAWAAHAAALLLLAV